MTNTGPRISSRSSSPLTRATSPGRAGVTRICSALTAMRRLTLTPLSYSFGSPSASPHPARIFFISVSAQAMESLAEVPVTALAIMLGSRYVLVMSCTLSEAGAGQP